MKREEKLVQLCHQFAIQILYTFGSRAKEVQTWLINEQAFLTESISDIDIGVKPQEPLTIREKVTLTQQLETLFGGSQVDLIILPEADPFLAANIIRGERLFTEDVYTADEYDLYILRCAGDLIPLELERQQLILSKTYDA